MVQSITGKINSAGEIRTKVLIIGCGLGGLSCAISCCNEGFDVVILEKAPKIAEIGAGIMVPPNASRILQHYGLYEKLQDAAAVDIKNFYLRRYEDGKILVDRPGGQKMVEEFGNPWSVVHRADYHRILMNEALRLGTVIREGAEVEKVEFSESPYVTLVDGEKIDAIMVVGADGLWLTVRDQLLGMPFPPSPTGDLAYRAVFSRSLLESLEDEKVTELINSGTSNVWIGPDSHCVFYPIKGGQEFNMVLLRPDDLEAGVRQAEGDVGEMRKCIKGWDPRLTTLMSPLKAVLKWKLLHKEELTKWVKGNVVLLGDSCHPTLPYQAQGAAMAVEDGAVIGHLLGNLYRSTLATNGQAKDHISSLFDLFEDQRKVRTSFNQRGAISNRQFFHMHDGPLQEERDAILIEGDWTKSQQWEWGDRNYQKNLLAFDVLKDADTAFGKWLKAKELSLKQVSSQ